MLCITFQIFECCIHSAFCNSLILCHFEKASPHEIIKQRGTLASQTSSLDSSVVARLLLFVCSIPLAHFVSVHLSDRAEVQ